MRRHPDHPLAGGEQRLLKPPRDVAAVLDRPHSLLVQPARPAHRGQVSRLLGLDLALAADPARALVDRRQRVRALVRVHPDHDHLPPSLRLVELPAKRISGGQLSLGAVATLLLGHAEGPRAAAGDRTFASQPGRRHSTEESARRQPENQPQRSDVTAQTSDSDSESTELEADREPAEPRSSAAPARRSSTCSSRW